MSTIVRTIRNIRRVGIKDAWRQLQYIGDTKSGTLIGHDRYGNRYFENLREELPLRTRWVDYRDHEFDPSQIEPGWHAWMSYMVDRPPGVGLGGLGQGQGGGDGGEGRDALMASGWREWEVKEHRPNMTMGRAAYRPYSTVKPKYSAWEPVTKSR